MMRLKVLGAKHVALLKARGIPATCARARFGTVSPPPESYDYGTISPPTDPSDNGTVSPSAESALDLAVKMSLRMSKEGT